MNSSNATNRAVSGVSNRHTALSNSGASTDSDAILVREAGLPYRPPASVDPIEQWLSLMEVVQMLCPAWPIRNRPMRGKHWRL